MSRPLHTNGRRLCIALGLLAVTSFVTVAHAGIGKLTKNQVLGLVAQEGWIPSGSDAETRFRARVDGHYAAGGKPFDLSMHEVKRLNEAGLSDQLLDLLLYGSRYRPSAASRLKAAKAKKRKSSVRKRTVARASSVPQCNANQVPDCFGRCIPYQRLGDGACDAELNCATTDFDDGDCAPALKFAHASLGFTATLPGLGNHAVQPNLGIRFQYEIWSELYIGLSLGLNAVDDGVDVEPAANPDDEDDPRDVDATVLGWVGWHIPLDNARTAFMDLRLGLGVMVGSEAEFALAAGPGVVVVLGDDVGVFLRVGIDLQLSTMTIADASEPTTAIVRCGIEAFRCGQEAYSYCPECGGSSGDSEFHTDVLYRVVPTLGFGMYF